MAQGATLAEIANALPRGAKLLGRDAVVTAVTHDSRRVEPGTLFVAIPGAVADGHDFIAAAIARGAAGVLVEREQDLEVGQIVVADARRSMAHAAAHVHGYPATAMTMVGITGTNGKTTVAHLCAAIWREAGVVGGVVGTLGAVIGDEPVPVARTTPESSDLQALLATMRSAGVEMVAMEVSSHAMELHRADAIVFDVAAFTNLTQDHLDFHGDMEAYFAAKRRLFAPDRVREAVIDVDDAYGSLLADTTAVPTTTVGAAHGADMTITGIATTPNDTRFTLHVDDQALTLTMPLLGRFNVANAAVAAAICLRLDIGYDAIARGLETVAPIRGRMEAIPHRGDFTVVVDYAHTPSAISEVLQSARTITEGRVIAVVGAAGDRDQSKRALMGAAAARFADLTIVTSDNPRSEDPATIAAEVREGVDSTPGARAQTVLDRGAAIETAIEAARASDIVLILGKGHEQGIEAAGVVTPFDDAEYARSVLADREGGR